MAGITSKMLFLNKTPMLVKATSDDSSPTPGYLYEDIKNLTFGSPGQTAELLDFLVKRLEYRSCYVKLKVLNVMIRLVQKGHPDFATGLRRRSTGINQATMHSGPRHALHDNAPYIAVRKAASELSTILFDTEKEADSTGSSMDSAGYGVNKSKTTMEGFGNTQTAQERTFTDQIKNGIQQLTGSLSAVEGSRCCSSGKVYKTIPSSTNKSYPNNKNTYNGSLLGDTPDVGAAAAGRREHVKKSTKEKVVQNPDLARVIYKGGKAGGGWEEDGSSDGVSSGHSNGSVPLSEKLESAVVEDWNQEAMCVEDIVGSHKDRLIPSRQELDQLERRCNTLNCDKVLEFLIQKITDYNSIIQMRALCAIERLLNTDLLGLVNETLEVSLQGVISTESTSKQAVSKSKKILRQIQNAVKQEELRSEPTPSVSKKATYAGQDLITATSNESVFNDSKENHNLQKGLPTSLNRSGQKNSIVDDHIGHKMDNFSTSLFDGLTMKADDSENGSNNVLAGTTESKANTRNSLPIGAQVLDLHTEQNVVGNSIIIGNSVMTTSYVKETSGCSKEPCGRTGQPQYKESKKDPLLSSDNNIDYLLASMNFKMDGKKVASSGTANDKIVMNQMPKTIIPQQQQQSLDKDRITSMFPQLSTSTLSGSSSIPLQLGKQNAGSFGFIAQTNTRSKPKPQEKFDFVQEAMKSAIAK